MKIFLDTAEVHHPLTDAGIAQFRKDWEEARKAAAK
jgi:transaldolase